MKTKFGGGGDFAYAYVISHEMGHHIQDLLGILPKAQAAQKNASSRRQANAISVRIELQADCFAGVWAANANQKWQLIEPGDVEKAIATAQAIGDDRLQKSSRGFAVPDSFTHGSSAQRVQWLETRPAIGQGVVLQYLRQLTLPPGDQPGGASSKPENWKAGATTQETSVQAPRLLAACQAPAGRFPATLRRRRDRGRGGRVFGGFGASPT